MKKVLILEDNETTRISLALLLNLRNYWVKTCTKVRDAMRAVDEGSLPDVVLVDYFLEDGNGLTFIEFLRSKPNGYKVNCLLATAATTCYVEQLREQMERLKIGVIFKPYEPDNVLEAIDRMAFPETQNAPHASMEKQSCQ